jgi:hypothetical protein
MAIVRRSLAAGFAAACLLLTFARPASALNVQLLRPSTGAVQGYQVQTSETLPRYDLSMGLEFNYVQHPLEVGISGTNKRLTGLVDRFITGDALFSFGATDWLTLNLDVPFNILHDIAPIFIPERDTGGPDMGDIQLSAKFRAFDAGATSSHLGLAFVPFMTFPTGRESVYFGDRWLTGGLLIAGDAQWKSNRFSLNLGFRLRKREQVANLVVKHEFLYGAAFQRPLWKAQHLDVIAEILGSTTFSKFFSEEISSPLQTQILLQKKFLSRQQLAAHIGGGFGFDNGYGAPDFRTMLGVSYTMNLGKQEQAPATPPAEEPPEK